MGAACCSDVSKAAPYRDQAASASEAGVAPLVAGGVAVVAAENGLSPDTKAVASSEYPPAAATVPAGPDPETAPAYEDAEDNRFISTVGELPQFNAPMRQFEDGISENGSQMGESVGGVSEMYDGMSVKEQQKQAKKVVKDFVKEMVKGKKMNVMKQNGQLTACMVSLTRALDSLKIKAGGQTREIKLVDIVEICAGTEVQDIDTPLDELCATLMLCTEDCITFRMVDLNGRDTFIMCLLMFCNNQK